MLLEVVSPEATLFSGEVNSVAVPGTNGAFQMLDNHAPIVSLLGPGKVKIGVSSVYLKTLLIILPNKEMTHFWNFPTEGR